MPMKLKTVTVEGKTYAEVMDEKPVYVHEDGKEIPFDAEQSVNKITQLNSEAKGHRVAKETAEAKLKVFEGIEDPEAAKHALETIKNIDEGKLLQAGKVEEIKAAARKTAEEQVAAANKKAAEDLAAATKERDTLQEQLYSEKIGGSFNRSRFINERVALPPDIVQKSFGSNFKVEDGKVVAYFNEGSKIYSRKTAGELADFDEALEQLIDAYPNKDYILKGKGGGTGARPGAGNGGPGGKKEISRQEFDRLDPVAKQKSVADGILVVDA